MILIKKLFAYLINMQVLPTVPSPTTTHLIGLPLDIVYVALSNFTNFAVGFTMNSLVY